MARMNKAQLLEGLDINPKQAKKIANNTLEYMDGDDRVIRHFHTEILRFKPDGSVVFHSGGWRSLTTKERMNKYQSLVNISQERRVWYVYPCNPRTGYADWKAQSHVFADGMTVHADGRIEGAGVKPDPKLVRKLRKYAKDFTAALPVAIPGAGDCFFCQMIVQGTETSLGDAQKNKDHLLSHVEESYFVPSLLYRAMKEAGATDLWMAAAFGQADFFLRPDDKWQQQQFTKWIFNYMYRRVIDDCFESTKPSEGYAA